MSCVEWDGLIRLIKHWREKDTRTPRATSDQLRQLRQHLRPDFEAVVPLHVTAGEVESRIARLTEDQLRLIDAVEANDRVICSGGAGTGKTMLGLELAKRWTAARMTVAMTCHSPWLKSFLERNSLVGLRFVYPTPYILHQEDPVSISSMHSSLMKGRTY